MTPRASLRSVTEMLEVIDWDSLSEDDRETIQTIGPWLTDGYSRAEIAHTLGISEPAIKEALDGLTEALLARAGELEDQLRERVEQLRRRAGGHQPG